MLERLLWMRVVSKLRKVVGSPNKSGKVLKTDFLISTVTFEEFTAHV